MKVLAEMVECVDERLDCRVPGSQVSLHDGAPVRGYTYREALAMVEREYDWSLAIAGRDATLRLAATAARREAIDAIGSTMLDDQ